jgi:hypothetical protein
MTILLDSLRYIKNNKLFHYFSVMASKDDSDVKGDTVHLEDVAISETEASRGAQIAEEERHLDPWVSAKQNWKALLCCRLRSSSVTDVD